MFEIRDDEIDVETIMARIRENLRRRGAEGQVPHDAVAIDDFPREPVSLRSGFLAHRLNFLRHFQDPQPQGPIASGGSGMIEWAKRHIRSGLAPYHRGLLARQAEFNANVFGLISDLLERLDRSGIEQAELADRARADIEHLQAQQAAHAQRAAEQADRIAALTTHIEHLQAQQAAHAQRAAEQADRIAALTTHIEHLQAQQAEAIAGLATRLDALIADQERHAAHLEGQLQELRGLVAEQRQTSEHLTETQVDLGKRLEEQRQEVILQKRRLELILSELGKKVGGKRTSLSKVVAQKERLTDHSYFQFESRHRGTLEEIRKRQEVYLPVFKERTESSPSPVIMPPKVVLDIGCGRGEFLELLREHGVTAKGIDLNEDMIYSCEERGLDVEQTDALAYLESQPDNSLGGVIACQVLEHFPTKEMIELIKLCYDKLERGGRAVFETVNPLSLLVSATNFYLDLSHVRQVHPATLRFLVEAIGFINTEIKFLSPYPDQLKLQLLADGDADVQTLNQNFARLNEILFGYQDYAVICEK